MLLDPQEIAELQATREFSKTKPKFSSNQNNEQLEQNNYNNDENDDGDDDDEQEAKRLEQIMSDLDVIKDLNLPSIDLKDLIYDNEDMLMDALAQDNQEYTKHVKAYELLNFSNFKPQDPPIQRTTLFGNNSSNHPPWMSKVANSDLKQDSEGISPTNQRSTNGMNGFANSNFVYPTVSTDGSMSSTSTAPHYGTNRGSGVSSFSASSVKANGYRGAGSGVVAAAVSGGAHENGLMQKPFVDGVNDMLGLGPNGQGNAGPLSGGTPSPGSSGFTPVASEQLSLQQFVDQIDKDNLFGN
ncbi:unnamed protein product [Ambrosiozyma monospora]|uniref:Unnamed protein product n=1 Tax=Ambrosiozyma monospora TaxID=43982 RepID=A0ACB5T7B2_AMBMO|nr:unnamed protein product [Ambrosiozyma monospora]